MLRRHLVSAMLIWLAMAGFSHAQTSASGRFTGWTSVVVSADWRSTDGTPIQAFDNARRDLTQAFQAAGFESDLMADISLRPGGPESVLAEEALARIAATAERGRAGCLLYFTSHGSPQGMVFGPDGWMTPRRLEALIDVWCGARPTVVVVSACYSGVFIPALAAPNRLILTAARADRSSFGCSEDATYPYFDGCILQSLPQATDFLALAAATRTCVSARERAEGLTPASEPQMAVGAEMQLRAPTLRFSHANGGR